MVLFAERYIDMSRFDLFIPVPLHKVKLRERAFNQSRALASHLSKRFNVPSLNSNLIRERAGKPQIELPKTERLERIKGSFRIMDPAPIKDKNILLVDDVFTTGATADECSKVLKGAGAGSVEVFALAQCRRS